MSVDGGPRYSCLLHSALLPVHKNEIRLRERVTCLVRVFGPGQALLSIVKNQKFNSKFGDLISFIKQFSVPSSN